MRDPGLDHQGFQTEQDRSPVVDLLACHHLADDRPVNLVKQSVGPHACFHDVVDDNRVAHMVVWVEVFEALLDFDVEDSHNTSTR